MKIGVVGIGKLGLCLALNLSRSGFEVVGFDQRQEYIHCLASKNFTSMEPGVNELLATTDVIFTAEINEVRPTDLVMVVVDTPSNSDGSFCHRNLDAVLDALQGYQGYIVICSTVMPGYCDSLGNHRIVYNPQFVAQGNILHHQRHPDFILVGTESAEADQLLQGIHDRLCLNQPVRRTVPRMAAEISKLALNCYITTKISFANMVGDLCLHNGIQPEQVLQTISCDTRVGTKCFSHGYGYGGPCFPRDNKAFIHFAQQYIEPHISRATEATNEEHFRQQKQLMDKGILPANVTISGDKAIINGVCFNERSKMLVESQQLRMALDLATQYKVVVQEDLAVIEELKQRFGDLFIYEAKS